MEIDLKRGRNRSIERLYLSGTTANAGVSVSMVQVLMSSFANLKAAKLRRGRHAGWRW